MRTVMKRLAGIAAGGCLAALAAAGCSAWLHEGSQMASAGSPVIAALPDGADQRAEVVLSLAPAAGRVVQQVVTAYRTTGIATLDVVPYVQTGTNAFSPLSAMTGGTTSVGAADMVHAAQASPGISITRAIVFKNLHPNKTYRFYARAYKSDGTQISDDASSSLDLALTTDDRPTVGTLPLRLLDQVFNGATTVTLTQTGSGSFNYLQTQLYRMNGSTEVALSGASQNIASPSFNGHKVNLSKLQQNTTYRLKASAYNNAGSVYSTNSVDIAVTTDDAPSPLSLSISIGRWISTLAGLGGTSGFVNGTGSAARFRDPWGIAVDSSGNVYVAEGATGVQMAIRKITPAGVVTTLTGGTTIGATDGPLGTATFNFMGDLVIDAAGNLYVAQYTSYIIRKISATGYVSAYAGVAGQGGTIINGATSSARFNSPQGLEIDAAGNLYVADAASHVIQKISTAGIVSTYAGIAEQSGGDDGATSSATFSGPRGLAIDSSGNVFVSERSANRIRKITPAGVVSTFSGSSGTIGADGPVSTVTFSGPQGMTFDSAGNLYVTELSGHRVRKITPGGTVSTIAGSGTSGNADGEPGTVSSPMDVCVDSAGNLYVTLFGGDTVRKIVQ